MNRAQAGRLESTLWLLNHSVFDLERLLELSEVDEPTFHWKSSFTDERKARIRARLAEVRAMIAALTRDHDLEKREENLLTRVAAQLHTQWVDIEDSKTKILKRYGEIPEGLKEKLDPELDRLNAGVNSLLAELRPPTT
jgi:hypothetical protein